MIERAVGVTLGSSFSRKRLKKQEQRDANCETLCATPLEGSWIVIRGVLDCGCASDYS